MAEVVELREDDPNVHARINRHFAWLAFETSEGTNRHLCEGTSDAAATLAPLRTEPLRGLSGSTDAGASPLLSALQRREPIPYDSELKVVRRRSESVERVVEDKATRISSLIHGATVECKRLEATPAAFADGTDLDAEGNEEAGVREEHPVYLRSPLGIALDFLTIPEFPGSGAFCKTTLLNFIFDSLGIYPAVDSKPGLRDEDRNTISVFDIQEALSHVETSLRKRHFSGGKDPLPYRGRIPAGTVLRQYLYMNDYLWLRFTNKTDRANYCSLESFVRGLERSNGKVEFVRSPFLEKLPPIGEIVNDIWGLQIPMRGADTVFHGGLRFSSEGGLVVAIHGGPGSGKTTLSLALGAYLSAFGIETIFVTSEEHENDLQLRADSIVPEAYKRLSFFPDSPDDWLVVQPVDPAIAGSAAGLSEAVEDLAGQIERPTDSVGSGARRPCNTIVVLDGIHDLLVGGPNEDETHGSLASGILRRFVARCRKLQALVILTTGEEWAGDSRIDYMVDVAVHLTNDATSEYGRKPDRRLRVTKARFQMAATGTHGLQLSGDKGVRLSPQINYQLERRTIWKSRLPTFDAVKAVMRVAVDADQARRLRSMGVAGQRAAAINSLRGHVYLAPNSVNVPVGSNIFINGRGSGGKAALALKLAMAPTFREEQLRFDQGKDRPKRIEDDLTRGNLVPGFEKTLIISFLYTEEYYRKIFGRLRLIRTIESPLAFKEAPPRFEVVHLYPGYMKPNDLYNRIEWKLHEAELNGVPFTSVIVDGIHNVFIQFPELQQYPLFWPQLFAMLRSRPLTTITTHTTMDLHFAGESELARNARIGVAIEEALTRVLGSGGTLDDRRSEPLRHALVQQTDYSFEVSPRDNSRNDFNVFVKSAIDQSIPNRPMRWSRELLMFQTEVQPELFDHSDR